ncbi:hypothetical protein LWI29_006026 [Acer saccharum]|uniref:DUF4218 domain-containing protein n=1 Tax=Acer saccharum TaxID=4024 RepID=A0AA39S782_ACESA|nr:hypothetical protein LWI29_006026 [Acer saccharum]
MYHGEVVDLSENVSNMSTMHNDEVLEEGDGLLEMLHDVGGQIPVGSGSIDDQDEGVESDHVQPGVAATTFDELLQQVQQELYPGCTQSSSLNFLVKLMHIKVLNHWSNKSFDMLIQLLNEVLPDGKNIPTSYYEAKKILRDLGLGNLGKLKRYVKNKAHPEGSIAEGYIVNELLTFCSMYLRGIETKFNRDERNDDGSRSSQNAERISIFSQKMKSLRYDGSPEATNDLYALACGPDNRVESYPGCIVNGVRYNIEERDKRHITQNCGLVVDGEHENATVDFYGILKDVIQLNYMFNYRAVLFKCDWFDTNVKKRIQKDYNYTCIDVSHKWYESDPYILAIQAHQVFYVNDHKFGSSWKVVQKIQHRHIWDVPEREEEVEEQEEVVETTILEVEEEDLDDHQFHREDVEAQTLDPNVVFLNQNDDMDDIDDVNEDETLINYNNDDEEIVQNNDDSDIDV